MSRRYLLSASSAFLLIALLIWIPFSHALDDEPVVKAEDSPILVELKGRISELVAKIHPEAKTYFQDNCLVCEYETMTFMVHGRHKGGGYSQKPTAMVGPNKNGFLVRVTIEDFSDGAGNQAGGLVLGVQRHIYWSDYINEYKIPGTNRVLQLQLSYGATYPDTRKLFDELRKVLAKTGEPILKITKEPEPPKGGFAGWEERRAEWNLFRDVAEQ